MKPSYAELLAMLEAARNELDAFGAESELMVKLDNMIASAKSE